MKRSSSPDKSTSSKNTSTLPKITKTTSSKWHQTLPADKDIDESMFDKPFDSILKSIADEMKSLDVDYIVERYKAVLPEFYELSSAYRNRCKKYNALFEKFVDTICGIYKITMDPIMVYGNKYSTQDWGHVYWEFLHLSSILLSYAYETDKIDTLLDFSTLIYQIDLILPCPLCAGHYAEIKDSLDVKNTIKAMSFGSVMISLQIFHNIITANVDKTPEYANRPNRDRFLISDFALEYKCTDVQNETNKKSKNYSKSCIDWQPTTHVLLSIILSAYCEQPSFDRNSKLLKYKLYMKDKNFAGITFKMCNASMLPIDASDIVFISMTEKQIKYCLMQALLLQFEEPMIQNKQLNSALIAIYQKYNDEIKEIVSKSNIEGRDTLLAKLDVVNSNIF